MKKEHRRKEHFDVFDEVITILLSSGLTSHETLDVLANLLCICARIEGVTESNMLKGLLEIWTRSGQAMNEEETEAKLIKNVFLAPTVGEA